MRLGRASFRKMISHSRVPTIKFPLPKCDQVPLVLCRKFRTVLSLVLHTLYNLPST